MPIEYQYVNKRNPVDPDAPPKVYALAVHNKTYYYLFYCGVLYYYP